MMSSWTRKTRKEMEEKTTDKTMRAWVDCSQSERGGPEIQGKNSQDY